MPLLDFATIPLWLQVLTYIYFFGSIIAAIYIAYDILKKRRMQKMPIMNVVWPVTVFYLFPLGLWAYWHLGHTYSRNSSTGQHHLVSTNTTVIRLVDHSGKAYLFLPPIAVLDVQLETS